MISIEEKIILLESHTDEATKQMLQNVIKRKLKFDKLQKRLKHVRIATFLLFALFLIYVTIFIAQPNIDSFGAIITAFINNSLHLYVLLFLFVLYGAVLYLIKTSDKAEIEFHALRCEIIRKSIELWPQPTQWQKRHHVFEIMQKEYDINLYHENK